MLVDWRNEWKSAITPECASWERGELTALWSRVTGGEIREEEGEGHICRTLSEMRIIAEKWQDLTEVSIESGCYVGSRLYRKYGKAARPTKRLLQQPWWRRMVVWARVAAMEVIRSSKISNTFWKQCQQDFLTGWLTVEHERKKNLVEKRAPRFWFLISLWTWFYSIYRHVF